MTIKKLRNAVILYLAAIKSESSLKHLQLYGNKVLEIYQKTPKEEIMKNDKKIFIQIAKDMTSRFRRRRHTV